MVSTRIAVFWDLTLSSMVELYQDSSETLVQVLADYMTSQNRTQH